MATDPNRPIYSSADMRLMAERLKVYRSLRWAGFVVLGIIVVFVGVMAAGLIQSSNRSADLTLGFNCKTKYESILNQPVIKRDNIAGDVTNLSASLESQLGAALLQAQIGNHATPAIVQTYELTKAALDAKRAQLTEQIAIVNTLPSINKAVTHGFTFAATHYPACPSA